LPKNIHVVGQGELVAVKLFDYLSRRSEINTKLNNTFSLSFCTTSNNDHVKQMMTYFYGENISVSTVTP